MNSKRNFIYNFFLLSFFFIGCSNSTIEDEPEMPPFNNETPSNSLCVAQFNIRYDTPEDGQYVWANRKTMAKEIITSHDFDIFGVNECLLNQLNDLLELKQYEYIGTGRWKRSWRVLPYSLQKRKSGIIISWTILVFRNSGQAV